MPKKRGKRKGKQSNFPAWVVILIILIVVALLAVLLAIILKDSKSTGNIISSSLYTQGRCYDSYRCPDGVGDDRGWYKVPCDWSCEDKKTQTSCDVTGSAPSGCTFYQHVCSSSSCLGGSAALAPSLKQ